MSIKSSLKHGNLIPANTTEYLHLGTGNITCIYCRLHPFGKVANILLKISTAFSCHDDSNTHEQHNEDVPHINGIV